MCKSNARRRQHCISRRKMTERIMQTWQSLGLAEAEIAMRAMERMLAKEGLAAVIVVADRHGDAILLRRSDGAPASSVTIALNKAWTSAREGVASGSLGARMKTASESFDIAFYGDPRYCGWGGALPVTKAGVCLGAVAVSGLPEALDVVVAQVGVDAILEA